MTSGLGDHNRGSALQALDAGCEAEIVIEVKTWNSGLSSPLYYCYSRGIRLLKSPDPPKASTVTEHLFPSIFRYLPWNTEEIPNTGI